MESSYSGIVVLSCPTEILVDLNEDDYVSSKDKSIHTSLHIQKEMKNIENDSSELNIKGKCQNIMDMSPIRVKNEYNEQTTDSFPNSEQDVDEDLHACPTAVLVDVPSSSRKGPQKPSLLYYKRDSHQEETASKSINQDVKGDEFDCMWDKYRTMEDSGNPCSLMTMMSESPPRVRIKTPSPKSMYRISKEASKIVYDLNSVLLDEDPPLCEEILPISINFDALDLDENSDEEITVPKTETPSDDKLSTNTKPSVSIQTKEEIINSEIGKAVSSSLSPGIQNVYNSSKPNIARSSSEPFNSKIKDQDLNSSSITSEELQSSEIQSGSFDDTVFFVSSSEPFNSKIKDKDLNTSSITSAELQSSEIKNGSFDDTGYCVSTGETSSVFIENNLTSDDKENEHEKERKEVFLSKPVINARALQKKSLPEKRIEKCPSLRNISNIKSNVTSRYLPSTNKRASLISSLSYNPVSLKSKEQKVDQKQVLKKTISAESPRVPKLISRSDSSQYDYRRESVYQSNFTKQKPPLLSKNKSSSSDVKHLGIQMKTPSRRYSIATPLQSASVKKTTLTPSVSRIQTPHIPRPSPCPMSIGGKRLSFSKSWQQSSLKGFKNQSSAQTSATIGKSSVSGSYSSKLNKQVLNQSISVLPSSSRCSSLSTTSKNRFCSKLNLPSSLNPEQDKKLARALFPSKPHN